MPVNVRLGGATVDVSVNAIGYTAGVNQAVGANRRLNASIVGMAANVTLSNNLFRRFSQSLSSSLIATAAYAAGVGVVSSAIRGVIGSYLEYDQALIRISKTTGVANQELATLGENLVRIATQGRRGRRPIDIAREDIFSIAVAAGQAGIADPREIEILTRASAALQSSSNLVGTQAVRAITRYLNVTGQAIERTDALASAFTHLGNNAVATESEIAEYSTRVAQNLSAVGQASDEFILAAGTAFVESGVQLELAGSAVQRAQLGLLRTAGDADTFAFIGQQAGEAADSFEELRQRFVDGTAAAEDYDRAFIALLRAFRSLPEVESEGGLPGQAQFLANILGGGENNVRNLRALGTLANFLPRVTELMDLAGESLENQGEHFTEAERQAEAFAARLRTVGRELQEIGTNIGAGITPALVAIAENFDLVGIAAGGVATALLAGFGQRRVTAIRQARRATREFATAQVAAAQSAQRAAQVQTIAARQTLRNASASAAAATQATRQQVEAQVALANRYVATDAALNRLNQSEQRRATILRNTAQLGTQSVARANAAVIVAQREVSQAGIAERQARATLQSANVVAAAGRTDSTRALLRGLRQYERAATQASIKTREFQAAQANLAVATRTTAQRIAALGRGLFAFVGGPFGLLLTGLAIGVPLLLRTRQEVDEIGQSFERLGGELERIAAQQQQEAAGITGEGATFNEARQFLAQQRLAQQAAIGQLRDAAEETFNDSVQRAIELGASPEAFAQARRILQDAQRALGGDLLDVGLLPSLRETFAAQGLGEQFDELVDRAQDIRDLEDQLSDAEEAMGGLAEAAQTAGGAIKSTFDALPPSILQALQAVRQLEQALTDATAQQVSQAVLQRQLVGVDSLGERNEITRRFQQEQQVARIRIDAARRVQIAQENAEQAADRLLEADQERQAIARGAPGSQALKDAEAQLRAAERLVDTTTQQLALARAFEDAARDIRVQYDQIAAANEIIARANIDTFVDDTRRQAEAVRPDFDSVSIEGLRQQIELERRLEDAQRDVIESRQIRAQETGAAAQAEREYFRIVNEGQNQLRDVEDALRVNEEARTLAARRFLDLDRQRVRAAENVTDALLERHRAAANNLASLRAEQQELELQRALLQGAADDWERLAQASSQAIRDAQRTPLDDLAISAGRLTENLEQLAADGFSRLSDEIAGFIATGEGDFRSFAQSIIQELLRILIQAQIVAPLLASLGFGGAGGGAGGGLSGLLGNFFHEGGEAGTGGRRRRTSGLRSDEIFAVLQKGEIVLPRALTQRLLAGDYDALASWLHRLPRYHEGGIAGGGHLPREDIVRLTAAIQQLQAVVGQLQSVVTRLAASPDQLAGGPFPGAPAVTPPAFAPGQRAVGLPEGAQLIEAQTGEFERFLGMAEEEVVGFAESAGETLRGFFVDDIPAFAEQARRAIEEELSGGDAPSRRDIAVPFTGLSGMTREVERQMQADEARARSAERRAEEDALRSRAQELIERADQPVGTPDSTRILEDIREELREQRRLPVPRERQEPEISQEVLERMRSDFGDDERFFRMFPDFQARFQDTGFPSLPGGTRGFASPGGDQGVLIPGEGILIPEETLNRYLRDVREAPPRAAGRIVGPGDLGGAEHPFLLEPDTASQNRRIDRLWERIIEAFPEDEVEDNFRFFDRTLQENQLPRPQPIGFGISGARAVGSTPVPQLLPDAGPEGSIQFREASRQAFAESADDLTNTFGTAGVAGQVIAEDSAGLLESVFGEGGAMGQFVGESEGLLSGLFGQFGGELSGVLQSVLGGLGGGGGFGQIFGLLGGLFFHEGGTAGAGGQRMPRPAGLRSDELLAVLQRGEIVLPRAMAQRIQSGSMHDIESIRSWLQRLPRFHTGGVVGGGSMSRGGEGGATRIELINQTSSRAELVDNGQRIDAGQSVQSFILRDVRRNGPVTQALAQRFRLGT